MSAIRKALPALLAVQCTIIKVIVRMGYNCVIAPPAAPVITNSMTRRIYSAICLQFVFIRVVFKKIIIKNFMTLMSNDLLEFRSGKFLLQALA